MTTPLHCTPLDSIGLDRTHTRTHLNHDWRWISSRRSTFSRMVDLTKEKVSHSIPFRSVITIFRSFPKDGGWINDHSKSKLANFSRMITRFFNFKINPELNQKWQLFWEAWFKVIASARTLSFPPSRPGRHSNQVKSLNDLMPHGMYSIAQHEKENLETKFKKFCANIFCSLYVEWRVSGLIRILTRAVWLLWIIIIQQIWKTITSWNK